MDDQKFSEAFETGKELLQKKKGRMIVGFVTGLAVCMIVFISADSLILSAIINSKMAVFYASAAQQIISARAAEISAVNESYLNDLRLFSDNEAVRSGDVSTMHAWFDRNADLGDSRFVTVFFCGPDGMQYQIGSSGAENFNIHDRPYFKAIMADGQKTYIGEPIVASSTGDVLYHYARAAYDRNGSLVGMIAGTMRPSDLLGQIVDSIHIGKKDYAFVVASDGTIIYHPDISLIMRATYRDGDKNGLKGMSAIIKAMSGGETSSGYYSSSTGRHLVVFAPVPGTTWSLGIDVPNSQIMSYSNSFITLIIASGVVLFAFMWIFCAAFLQRSLKPVNTVEKEIGNIATGDADLTRRIDINRHDEVGRLVDGFNLFMGRLQNIITTIKKSDSDLSSVEEQLRLSVDETASSITQILGNIESVDRQVQTQASGVEETAGAVTEIAHNIESLEKMIQNQAAGVTEASAAVEEMIGNIGSVDGSVEKMASEFGLLQTDAHAGVEKQNAVNEAVRLIADQSAMLQEANAAIANIAQQTNLLAMNAAIEAAHAGEAGKGFSVVADEIRKLSETSSEQSRTIGEELEKIVGSIDSVVQASEDSGDTFMAVAAKIAQTDEVVRQIREAMQQQQEGSRQILEALRNMNDSTSEVRSASAEMSAGNKAILGEVKLLQDSTIAIRDSMGEIMSGAKSINVTSSRLSDMSHAVSASVRTISDEIGQFKV